MKKLFSLLMLVCGVMLASCTEDSSTDDVKSPVPELSQLSLSVPTGGDQCSVEVGSELEWDASCDADWVEIEKNAGVLNVRVLPNTTTQKRTADIWVWLVADPSVKTKLTITQEAFVPSLVLSQKSLSCDSEGDEVELCVESNIDWTVACDADWVELSIDKGDKGETMMTVKVLPTDEPEGRTTDIIFTNTEYSVEEKLAVAQTAYQAALSLSTDLVECSARGFDSEFFVVSDVTWVATVSDEWIRITPSEGEQGETMVLVGVDENTDTTPRSGRIVVRNEQYNIEKFVDVKQEAAEGFINLSAVEQSVAAAGETFDLAVNSNIAWKATDDADWVTLTPTEGTAGEGTITISVDANTSLDDRVATVTVAATDGTLPQTLTIAQEGAVGIINFECARFKSLCVAQFDKDGDGEVSTAEAEAASYVDVDDRGVTSMAEIKYFKNITTLRCDGNNLAELNVSENLKLRIIHCDDNALTELDLSNNEDLDNLYCRNNQLTKLTLPDVGLTDIYCDDNKLTELKFRGGNIVNLYCSDNLLTEIDVTNCGSMKWLDISGNDIPNIDVSACSKLKEFKCISTKITELNVANLRNLQEINCNNNAQLTSLNVSGCTGLMRLYSQNTGLTSIDLSTCSDVRYVLFQGSPIKAMDFSGLTTLRYIEADDCGLQSLKVTGCTGLEEIYCRNNLLTELDLTTNADLVKFKCTGNPNLKIYLATGHTLTTFEKDDTAEVIYQ